MYDELNHDEGWEGLLCDRGIMHLWPVLKKKVIYQ